MASLDPRTKLALGTTAMAAVFAARALETLVAQCVLLLLSLPLLGMLRAWLRSLRLVWPMLSLVFLISYFSFEIPVTVALTLRLFNLLTVSFILFRTTGPEQMGDALRKLRIPYNFAFILTTAMRYVPLIGQRIRHIMDAQISRGIDLRPRIKNVGNFMALLMPLLVQAFVLSEELAMAMESRGFARKGRSSRRNYRLTALDYGLLCAASALLVAFICWERGWGL